MRARASIHIDREPHAVFARLADFATHSSWRSEVTSTQVLGEIGVGTRLIQHVSVQGRSAVLDIEITEFAEAERISFRSRGGLRARGGFRLEPEDGGTRVHLSATVQLNGSASLVEDRIRTAAEAGARADLLRLKEQLEHGRQGRGG